MSLSDAINSYGWIRGREHIPDLGKCMVQTGNTPD